MQPPDFREQNKSIIFQQTEAAIKKKQHIAWEITIVTIKVSFVMLW